MHENIIQVQGAMHSLVDGHMDYMSNDLSKCGHHNKLSTMEIPLKHLLNQCMNHAWKQEHKTK